MKIIASITQSVDGYVTGPDDGPGLGLGRGGERLHYWVFGGPWTYDDDERDLGKMTGEDKVYFDALVSGLGAAICGRGMYDAAGAWGGTNPFGGRLSEGFGKDLDLEILDVHPSPFATHVTYAVRR